MSRGRSAQRNITPPMAASKQVVAIIPEGYTKIENPAPDQRVDAHVVFETVEVAEDVGVKFSDNVVPEVEIIADGAALSDINEPPPAQTPKMVKMIDGEMVSSASITNIRILKEPDGIGNTRHSVYIWDAMKAKESCYASSWYADKAREIQDNLAAMIGFTDVIEPPVALENVPKAAYSGFNDTSREAYLAMQGKTLEGAVYAGDDPLTLIANPGLPMYAAQDTARSEPQEPYAFINPLERVNAHTPVSMGWDGQGLNAQVAAMTSPGSKYMPPSQFQEAARAAVEPVSYSTNPTINPGDRRDATEFTVPEHAPYSIYSPAQGSGVAQHEWVGSGPGYPTDAQGRPQRTQDGMQIFDASHVSELQNGDGRQLQHDPVAQQFLKTYEPTTNISLPATPTT